MRDLRSDDTRSSTFFAAHKKCGTISVKKPWTKRAKSIKKANESKTENQLFFVYLRLPLLLSSLFFSPHFLLENKNNTSNNQKLRTQRPAYLLSLSFFSLKPRNSSPRNSFRQNILALLFFYISRSKHKSWMNSSANTYHRARSSKLYQL